MTDLDIPCLNIQVLERRVLASITTHPLLITSKEIQETRKTKYDSVLFKYRGVADLKKAQIYPSIDEEEFLHLHDDIRSTELPRSTFFF